MRTILTKHIRSIIQPSRAQQTILETNTIKSEQLKNIFFNKIYNHILYTKMKDFCTNKPYKYKSVEQFKFKETMVNFFIDFLSNTESKQLLTQWYKEISPNPKAFGIKKSKKGKKGKKDKKKVN